MREGSSISWGGDEPFLTQTFSSMAYLDEK